MKNSLFHSSEYAKILSQFESNDKSKLGVIFIEDITDKKFWQSIATKHQVKLYSENGKTITGKSKLLEICDKHQLIAIDSDFDDLCPNHRLESLLLSDKKEYILKTYTHGLENIVFSPDCLGQILDEKFQLYLENHDNEIDNIFQQLSEIWFEPYQKFLYLFNLNKYKHDCWMEYIKFKDKECQNIALSHDFSAYKVRMLALDTQLDQQIDNRDKFNDFCKELTKKYFEKHNVWAFIRCHDFKDSFVIPLLKATIKHRQDKEFGDVQNNYAQNGISDRRKGIANYFKEINNIETVLHHYFYDVYFKKEKQNHQFISKIISDYHAIIG